MSTTIIPQAQFAALPYITVAEYLAVGGDVEIVPGQISRYFSPVDLGMNNLVGNASDPITHDYSAQSAAVNCRGCRRFTFALAVKMREAVNPGLEHDQDWQIQVYSKCWVPAEPGVRIAPQVGNFTNAWDYCGLIHFPVAYPFGFPPPVMGVYPTLYKTASCSWELGDTAQGGGVQAGLTGAMGIRLKSANGITGAHFDAYLYGSLWASS
jgi:hypothetical protein